jgi:hypothetical protein
MSFSVRNNQKILVASPSAPFYPPNYWSANIGNVIYNNNLPNGKVGINTATPLFTFDISTPSTDGMRIQSPNYVGVVYENNNNNVNMTNGTLVFQLDCTGRRNNTQSSLYKASVIYNGDGTTRRGRYEDGVGDVSDFGSYQRVMTQFGSNRINIFGEDASGYIDDAVNPNTAYNMHASNIINARSGSLGLLSLDINGITNHKFFSNGNVTFGGTSNNPKAIVDISSTSKGFMLPRMTGPQAFAINPGPNEAGLMVYATSANSPSDISATGWWGWNGTAWRQLA